MAIGNVNLSNLTSQSILNAQQTTNANTANGQISPEDFDKALNQYLTSYTNQTSKKSSPLATALGADDSLIDELLSSSNGRKVISQMTENHLMDVVTSSTTKATESTTSTENKIKELQEQTKTDSTSTSEKTDVKISDLDITNLNDTFTSLADLLKTSQLKVKK